MDFSSPQPQDYMTPDSNYSPQIINEQDQAMGGTDEQASNGHGNGHIMSPPLTDGDNNSRYSSPNLAYQQQPSSRPGSGLGGQQAYQQDSRQAQPASKSSVVIKVGMVGDAQIGKTSLMVKYVEGSWDEDYIQTLGVWKNQHCGQVLLRLTRCRCQLHGEDDLNSKHGNHILDMGSWRTARIRQHATTCLQ